MSRLLINAYITFNDDTPVAEQISNQDEREDGDFYASLGERLFLELNEGEQLSAVQNKFADIIETGVAEFDYVIIGDVDKSKSEIRQLERERFSNYYKKEELDYEFPELPEPNCKALATLVDGLSDMIEGGRLTEALVPDDWQWLMKFMTTVPPRMGADGRPCPSCEAAEDSLLARFKVQMDASILENHQENMSEMEEDNEQWDSAIEAGCEGFEDGWKAAYQLLQKLLEEKIDI